MQLQFISTASTGNPYTKINLINLPYSKSWSSNQKSNTYSLIQ